MIKYVSFREKSTSAISMVFVIVKYYIPTFKESGNSGMLAVGYLWND